MPSIIGLLRRGSIVLLTSAALATTVATHATASDDETCEQRWQQSSVSGECNAYNNNWYNFTQKCGIGALCPTDNGGQQQNFVQCGLNDIAAMYNDNGTLHCPT